MTIKNKISFRPNIIASIFAVMFSSHLWAASSTPSPILRTPELERVEMKTESVRRERIIQSTQNTFTLLGAEMALLNGNPHLALHTYVSVLAKTQDPEVAERAMELAVNLQDYLLAEEIFTIWQKIEPNPSPSQRRILWTRALANNDTEYAFNHLDTILRESNEEQVRRIFLLLAQVGIQNRVLSQQGSQTVHKAAWRYPQMPEAMVADALYLMSANNEKEMMKTIAQLAKSDAEISDVSRLGLSLLMRENPNTLLTFFDKHDSRKMSARWQELEFESLIQAKEYQKAEKRLQYLLKQQPESASLYLLAGIHAYQQNNDSVQTIEYLKKAHQYALEPQKSHAATLLALRFLADKQYHEAGQWIEHIHAPVHALDKRALMASLAAEQQDWQKALTLSNFHEPNSHTEQGKIFQLSDLNSIYLLALNKTMPPAKILQELNQLIKKTNKNEQVELYSMLLLNRGILYVDKLNRWYDGVADLRAYYALNPNKADAQNSLGYTLLSKPESVDEGFALIAQAYKQQPENAAINDSMGWAYAKKGDYATALMYLQFAYDKLPDAEIAAHLGEVYWHLGEHDKARGVWQAALDKKDDKENILLETLRRLGVKL